MFRTVQRLLSWPFHVMVRSWEWFVPPVGTTQLLEEQEEGLSVKLHDKDDESSEETTETTMTPAYTPGQRVTLFDLPLELRDMIWTLTLQKDHRIMVPKNQPLRPPSLINACKQTRDEALPEWFLVNRFKARIVHLDMTPVIHLMSSARAVGASIEVDLEIVSSCHWDNLMDWIDYDRYERWHPGRIRVISKQSDTNTVAVLKATIHILTVWRGKSFQELQDALEAFREVAGLSNPRWLIDHR